MSYQSFKMGYSYGQSDGPIMCFNSAKMWQLGWYGNSRRLIIDSDSNDYIGPLVGIVDQISGPYVIKLEKAGTSYFMNFNKKASFNSGTVEGGNQVLITKQAAIGKSSLLAKLSEGQSWISPAVFAGKAITVTVTDIDFNASVEVCIGTCQSCEDSSSKIPGYSQTCKNVQSFNLKKYKKYCSRNVVHKHCPETCGKCLAESSCVDANEINKTCLWIHFKQSRLFKNCGKTFIKFQCPSTCNQCMNL
mmetsp:Transcript_5312/g.7747  ORF Transcript_5312/g.7747 Transcript_5312/m.7747 type:complete len:247 (-) Transcript_5312:419-1159(-)